MNRLNALDFCLQIFKYQIILNLFNFFQAFTSWICYYKTFEADLRKYFCFKNLHLGHLAGNLGLRDSPGDIARDAVRNQEERKDKKMWDFIKLFFFFVIKMCNFYRNARLEFKHRPNIVRGPPGKNNKMKRKYGDFSKTNFNRIPEVSEFDSGIPQKKRKTN